MLPTHHQSTTDPSTVEPNMSQQRQHPRISWAGLGLVFMTPALGGFLYGYDIGATAFVLAMLRENRDVDDATTPQAWWYDFGRDDGGMQEGLFIAAMSLGALLGSHLVLFHLASTIGRRMELRVASILYMIGTGLQMASGSPWVSASAAWLGWPLLFCGRALFGMGIGFVMHGAPNYMAEMAPSHIRGAIVSAKETLIVLGIFFGYAVGDFISHKSVYDNTYDDDDFDGLQLSFNNDWTKLYQVSFFLSIPMFGLTFVVPRSVRWLLTQQSRLEELDSSNDISQEARQSMQFLYRDDATAELHHLTQQVRANHCLTKQESTPAAAGMGCGSTLTMLFGDPTCSQPLFVALGIIFLMESSGQPAILSYTTILYEEAGWSGHASVMTASLMLFFSTITIFLVDVLGRKRLLQICASIMGVSLLILSVLAPYVWGFNTSTSEVVDDEDGEGTAEPAAWQKLAVLLAMFVYVGSYQLGFGPITWVVVAEVFPSHVRGHATALAVEVKYVLQFIVQFAVPILQQRLGWRITFGSFACFMAFAAMVFIPTFVPETKGLTLEQIEAKTRESCYYEKSATKSTILDDDDDDTSMVTDESPSEISHLLGGELRESTQQPDKSDYTLLELADA